MRRTDVVLAIARKEFGDGLRNRWIWTVCAVLTVSSLAIAFFGAVPAGVVAANASDATIASLMNLTVYVVPLLALVIGCGAIIDEKHRGMLDLFLVYPFSPAAYFFGTFLGYALALSAAIVCSFALSGIALGFWSGADIGAVAPLCALAVVLGCVFLGISFLVSILSRDRGRAVALSVLVWIIAVFLYDLILVGILVASEGSVPQAVFAQLLLLNPTDLFRMLYLRIAGSTASSLGMSVAVLFVPSSATLVGVFVLWLVSPVLASYAVFRRRVAADTLV